MRLRVRAGIGLAAAILAITALAPVAQAQTDLRGRWQGFMESQLPAAQIGDSFFDVFTQRGGSFQGTMQIPGAIDPCVFTIKGIVRSNGVLFGTGFEADGSFIVFTGRTKALGDGSVQIVTLLLGHNDIEGGEVNQVNWGVTVYIQMQGGLNWRDPGPPQVPDLSGLWTGDYLPRLGEGGGPISFDLDPLLDDFFGITSNFMGSALMLNVFVPAVQSFFDITYDVQGTVGVPAVQRDGSMASPFGTVGICPSDPSRPGIIAILIGLYKPPNPSNALPAVQGEYRLYDSFFDVFTEIALDGNTAFGQGSFTCILRPPS